MISHDDEELTELTRLAADTLREPVTVRAEWRDALLMRIDEDSRRQARWAVRPWMLAAAAILIFTLGIGAGRLSRPVTERPAAGGAAASVRFVYVAPDAKAVALVGDFNQWNPAAVPLRRLSDGTWIADVPLIPGRYAYAFLVDGKLQADPAAPRATPKDDFGFANSVLMVRGS